MPSESTRVTLLRCMRKLVREKSFQKISISEICDLAHIARRTFYHYYSDKYALLQDVNNVYIFGKMGVEEGDTYWDILRKYGHMVMKEKDYYLHAFEVEDQNGFWEQQCELMMPYVLRSYPNAETITAKEKLLIKADILSIIWITDDWIKHDCVPDPDTFWCECRKAYAAHGKFMYESSLGKKATPIAQEELEVAFGTTS